MHSAGPGPASRRRPLLRDPTEGFFAVVERSSRPNVFVMHSAGPGPASRRRPLLFISAERGGGLCMTEPGGTLARASDGGEDEHGRPRRFLHVSRGGDAALALCALLASAKLG